MERLDTQSENLYHTLTLIADGKNKGHPKSYWLHFMITICYPSTSYSELEKQNDKYPTVIIGVEMFAQISHIMFPNHLENLKPEFIILRILPDLINFVPR